jgi:hypothetical protein
LYYICDKEIKISKKIKKNNHEKIIHFSRCCFTKHGSICTNYVEFRQNAFTFTVYYYSPFQITGTIKRSDFGFGSKFGSPMLSDEVAIKANGEFGKAN